MQEGPHRRIASSSVAVVATVEPPNLDRRTGSSDLTGGGVSLIETEEGIALTLDKQGRCLDVRRVGNRRVRSEERQQFRCRGSGDERLDARTAQGFVEPATDLLADAGRWSGVGRRVLVGGTARAEKYSGPAAFEHAGRRDPRAGQGCRIIRKERLAQVVPGDRGGDGVDSRIGAAEHQCECAAVRSTRDSDVWVAGRVQRDLGANGQPAHQLSCVRDLAVGVVDRDGAGALAESSCTVGEYDEPVSSEPPRLIVDRFFAPTEAVGKQDGGGRRRLRLVHACVQRYCCRVAWSGGHGDGDVFGGNRRRVIGFRCRETERNDYRGGTGDRSCAPPPNSHHTNVCGNFDH